MYDVVVIGAGPCGSAAAQVCAKNGLKTLLIEEHATIGYPVQCAGLISTNAFAECNISKKSVIREVCGARMISGTGCELLFDAGVTKAYVVDRGRLDFEMAENAVRAGADIQVKSSVYDIDGRDLLVKGVNGRECIPFKLIIAADGPRSLLSRIYGMKRSSVYLSGIQADIPLQMDGRYVELHPYASPDFFGWVIPSESGTARIGICGTGDVNQHFNKFMKNFNSQCMNLVTGTVPLGVMPKTYGNRTLFVGDAAGFAKPTSGGGIYTGVRSARHAAGVAVECCKQEKFDDKALSEYEKLWQEDFGRELSVGLKLFRMRQHISDKQIHSLCQVLNEPEMIETIVKYGDMDRPGELIKRLVTKPAILKAFGLAFCSELRSFVK